MQLGMFVTFWKLCMHLIKYFGHKNANIGVQLLFWLISKLFISASNAKLQKRCAKAQSLKWIKIYITKKGQQN